MVMGDVATIPLFFDRIYRILRIFCFYFHFPDENENTKSLREVAWTSGCWKKSKLRWIVGGFCLNRECNGGRW
jgi:hypothetical protein